MKYIAVAVGLLALAVSPSVNAQAPSAEIRVNVIGHAGSVSGSSAEHFLTFDSPVGVPGVGLAPGEYVFRTIAPSMMQVVSSNRSKILATFFVTRTERPDALPNYSVALTRTSAEAPPRITMLFLPDTFVGYEFLYPPTTPAVGSN